MDDRIPLSKHTTREQRTSDVFIFAGVALLTSVCIVPIWNALDLLHDDNFLYWVGPTLPLTLLFVCFATITIYVVFVSCFFSRAPPTGHTSQHIILIPSLFLISLGLMFMLVAMPMSERSHNTYNNLMHRCHESDETRKLHEYSQVLHNIRALPTCITRYSVVECEGYRDLKPHATFLKVLEDKYECSGFCYTPVEPPVAQFAPPPYLPGPALPTLPTGAAVLTPAPTALTTTTTTMAACMLRIPPECGASNIQANSIWNEACVACNVKCRCSFDWASNAPTLPGVCSCVAANTTTGPPGVPAVGLLQLRGESFESASASARASSRRLVQLPGAFPSAAAYPPTLFSQRNYQAACESMAARDVMNVAGAFSYQIFHIGCYLVGISILFGLLKSCGYCIPADKEFVHISDIGTEGEYERATKDYT
jgi:hypothetical protein